MFCSASLLFLFQTLPEGQLLENYAFRELFVFSFFSRQSVKRELVFLAKMMLIIVNENRADFAD